MRCLTFSTSKIAPTTIKSIIKKYNCIEDTIKRAQHFGNVAIDSLNVLKSNNYKECLINLMQASIKRIS